MAQQEQATDSASVQDYVKSIYTSSEWQDKPVTASQLAARLGVANSSVTGMVKKLAALGLVAHRPYGPLELTQEGLSLALAMVRRHRLLETFLVRDLGYSWDEVHDEAELLEHTVSDTFIARLDRRLGFPAHDPHGDPIPTADGEIRLPDAHALPVLDEGHCGTVARISDADPEVLRFLAGESVGLGTRVKVVGRQPFGGALTVAVEPGADERRLDMGDQLAASVWVESLGSHAGCALER
jgi:DtxR family Mn-dependent transcriptional regulator